MIKKRKRLFMFRAGEEIGMVRAFDILEALDVIRSFCSGPVDICRVPIKYTLFIPLFGEGRDN